MKTIHLLTIACLATLLSSCYYDKYDELYPAAGNTGIDTLNPTYTGAVSGIFKNYCNSCHSTSIANGGVILDTYEGAKQAVLTRRLVESVRHDPNAIPMPQGGPKLSNDKIAAIENWVSHNMPQ